MGAAAPAVADGAFFFFGGPAAFGEVLRGFFDPGGEVFPDERTGAGLFVPAFDFVVFDPLDFFDVFLIDPFGGCGGCDPGYIGICRGGGG